jgi:hypothetical protein
MSALTRQASINSAFDLRGAELRMQCITQETALKALRLAEMLEWYGSDLMVGQSPAGFKTTVQAIRRWHELQEGAQE